MYSFRQPAPGRASFFRAYRLAATAGSLYRFLGRIFPFNAFRKTKYTETPAPVSTKITRLRCMFEATITPGFNFYKTAAATPYETEKIQ
jgi:hypothetical protein